MSPLSEILAWHEIAERRSPLWQPSRFYPSASQLCPLPLPTVRVGAALSGYASWPAEIARAGAEHMRAPRYAK